MKLICRVTRQEIRRFLLFKSFLPDFIRKCHLLSTTNYYVDDKGRDVRYHQAYLVKTDANDYYKVWEAENLVCWLKLQVKVMTNGRSPVNYCEAKNAQYPERPY